MKLYRTALFFGLISLNVAAQDVFPPIENVSVSSTDSNTLAVHNFSASSVFIDIYGNKFEISASSGLSFQCEGYQQLEIQVQDLNHDYFETPCNSRVIFDENFKVKW